MQRERYDQDCDILYRRYLERYDQDCVTSCSWDMIRTVWYRVHEIWSRTVWYPVHEIWSGLCDILYMRYDQDCVISCTWDMIRTVWYPVQEIFQKQEMCPSTFRFTRGIHRFNQPRSKTVFSWECQGYQSLVVYSPPGLIMGAAILEKAPFNILNNKSLTKQNMELL